VQLDHPLAPGAPVQAVHVLGDEEQAIAETALGGGKGVVAGVGVDVLHLAPARRVEPPHQSRVLPESLGGGDLLHGHALPEAAGRAEGRHPALRRHPGSGQDEEPCVVVEPQWHR